MQDVVLGLVRNRAKKALLGMPDQAEYVANADNIFRCGQKLDRTIRQWSPMSLEVYLDNMKDVCELLDYVVEEWTEGCEDFFGLIMADREDFVSYVVCTVALDCRKDVTRPDFVHGVCLKRCRNEGNRTMCEEPALVRAGLTHENVCNECVPAIAALNYMTFPEMCATLAAADVLTMFDRVVSALFRLVQVMMQRETAKTIEMPTIEMPEPLQVVNLHLQLLVVCNILKFAFSVLSECGGTCRFAVLTTPLLYAPYAYSLAVCVNVIVYLIGPRTAYRLMNHGVDKTMAAKMKHKRFLAMVPAAIIVYALMAVKLIFVIPMAIGAIFPAIAYVHIFALMVFLLGSIAAFLLLMGFCEGKGREQTETVKETVPMQASYAGSLMLFLAGGAYYFTSCFFLYVTGDWSAFHSAFFEETFPPSAPGWPSFHLLNAFAEVVTLNGFSATAVNLDVLAEVLEKLLTFGFTLPDAMLEMGMIFSILTFFLNIIIKAAVLVYSCRRNYKRRGETGNANGAPTASRIGASDVQL